MLPTGIKVAVYCQNLIEPEEVLFDLVLLL